MRRKAPSYEDVHELIEAVGRTTLPNGRSRRLVSFSDREYSTLWALMEREMERLQAEAQPELGLLR